MEDINKLTEEELQEAYTRNVRAAIFDILNVVDFDTIPFEDPRGGRVTKHVSYVALLSGCLSILIENGKQLSKDLGDEECEDIDRLSELKQELMQASVSILERCSQAGWSREVKDDPNEGGDDNS